MSDNQGSDKGVHYHYHFYGYGQGPQDQTQQQPQNGYAASPAGNAPADQQSAPGANGPAGWQQQAPGFAPGAVPPGFPFPPGAPFNQQSGAAQANTAGAAPGNANWHQHPTADSLVKGLAIGAGAAYLLTNEAAQRTILRSAVQVWALLQNGIEELKERLQDAEAEVAAAAEPAEDTHTDASTTSGS